MTIHEIFDKIIETTAQVCNVPVDAILGGARDSDVVMARSLVVLWCSEGAKMSTDSIMKLSGCRNANSINSIKSRIDDMWKESYVYHMLAKEIGTRLQEYGKTIGQEFDPSIPLMRVAKRTRKYLDSISK